MLKKYWTKLIELNWKFGLLLILGLGIPRFIIVLRANVTGNFNFQGIIFLVMWILPFIYLSKKGRKYIGFTKIKNWRWFFYSIGIGGITSIVVFYIGFLIYQNTNYNWFTYIGKPFEIYGDLNPSDKQTYFVISAIIAMTFSPIGEEVFYRGMVHGCFESNFGKTKASYIDSLAFAITHLAHFGIVFLNGKWEFLIIPSILWMTLMFFTSRLFFLCKEKSGSIVGAIISHSAFNLVMMYVIFYKLI
jgi:membrane protease YdiL (CAAX protease family)